MQVDRDIAAVFPEQLTAGAAWGGQDGGIGDNRHFARSRAAPSLSAFHRATRSAQTLNP